MQIEHSFLGGTQKMLHARTPRCATARFNRNLLAHQMNLVSRCLPTGTSLGVDPDITVYTGGARRATLAGVFQRSAKVAIVR